MLPTKRNLQSSLKVGQILSLLISMMFILQACFPYGPEDIEEFDIVATFYDKNVNFANVKTYAMPDSVAHIGSDGTGQAGEGQYDDLLLSQVATNMQAIGYERIQNPDDADVVITISITRESYSLYNNYDYSDNWNYYTPGYGGYGYGYGGYSDQTYDMETGTILIVMGDLKNAANNTIPAPWMGAINGIVEQSFTNTSRRIITLVNTCFTQSPYLGTTPQ